MTGRVAWTLLAVALAAAAGAGAYAGINALDEPLSAEAARLLELPSLPAPGADNAWDEGSRFREAGASIRWFVMNESPIAKAQQKRADLEQLLQKQAASYARYREIRSKPRYGETSWVTKPGSPVTLDRSLIPGNHLALAQVALDALDGRLEAAIAELEREVAHHRRVVAGSRTLLFRVIGAALLARDMAMLSDLITLHGRRLAPYRERVLRMAAPLPREALDLTASFELEALSQAQVFMQYREAMTRDREAINGARAAMDQPPLRRWHAFGYRPRQTVNEYARRLDAQRQGLKAAYERAWSGEGLDPAPVKPAPSPGWRFVNPTGYAMLDDDFFVPRWQHYVRRMNDISALVAMVRVQASVALDDRFRDAFARQVARSSQLVLDEPFRSRARFDGIAGQLRYQPWEATSGWIRDFASRFDGDFAVLVSPK